MWNDNETDLDFIDYQHLINAIESIVDNEALLPSSIGIFGDWGSGKSSLMKMIGTRLIIPGSLTHRFR
jgi:ABC-type Na+ transport system ATPase subunit NatA